MQFGKRRLSLAWLTVMMIVLAACRPSAPGGSATDSATPAPRADSTPSPSASNTARADSVVLRTDKTQYRAGEKMTLTLENKSGSSYAFNPCTRSLERQAGSSWTAVPDEGRMCTMEAWILDPHGTRSGPTELPASLTPGQYRVVVRMTQERSGGAPASAVSAISEPIAVS